MSGGGTKAGEQVRPWRDRIWFYRPGSWLPGWRFVQWDGGDQYDWHTLVIGSRLTGAVVIALHPCRGTGRCADQPSEMRSWPGRPTQGGAE